MKILHTKGLDRGNKRVFISVPSYGQISAETTFSLFAAKEVLIQNNIDSELYIITENCHIDDGRNYVVRDFLASKCDELVFIDADVRFEPEDLVKLSLYPFDVVAGIYPKKNEETEYPVRFLSDRSEIWSNEYGLIEVESVPTGFLKVRRNVLEKLYEKSKKYVPQKDKFHKLRVPLIFERCIHGYTRLGGDYEFCRKWREIGGKIHIDPMMSFGHVGTKEFSGILANHLWRENGLIEDRIKDLLKKISDKTAEITDYMMLFDAWGNKWACTPDMLLTLAEIDVDTVLEYGSGLSTLVMAASGKMVVALENNINWYNRINKQLNGYDVDLRLCNLKDGRYDFVPEEKYSCIVIDGPNRKDGTRLNDIPKCDVLIVDDVDQSIIDHYNDFDFNVFGRFAIGKTRSA